MFKQIISRFGFWLLKISDFNEKLMPALLNSADYRRDTAYLVVQFTTDSPIPIVQHVGIFSSPAEQLTGINEQVSATIMAINGKNYHKARENLEEWVFHDPRLKWARPWFEKDKMGRFNKLYERQAFVQRCVDVMRTIEVVEE